MPAPLAHYGDSRIRARNAEFASRELPSSERVSIPLCENLDAEPRAQRYLGEYHGHVLIDYKGECFAVPTVAGPVCLADPRLRMHPWIFSAASRALLHEEISRRNDTGESPRHVESLAGHHIYRSRGHFHAVVSGSHGDANCNGCLTDPTTIAGDSLPELRRLVLQVAGREIPGEIQATLNGYVLTQLHEGVSAYPLNLTGAEYLPATDQEAAGVLHGATREAVEDAVRKQNPPRPVEFLGWLPAFRKYGDCGNHPQFGHSAVPPAGYKFVQSAAPSRRVRSREGYQRYAGKIVRAIKVGMASARLFTKCVSQGSGIRETLNFLNDRDLQSQHLIPRKSRLVFLTSVPFTLGQDPWVIEIEDVASLLYPYVHNGRTAGVDVEQIPGFRAVKTLLELPNCRGIITHIRATHDGIAKLFRSPIISAKTTHIPMGISVPLEWQRHAPATTLNLLFTNSWHQAANSFYVRGGLDVLEAFSALHQAYPQLRLTLRTKLPNNLPVRYRNIIDHCGVTVLDEFLSAHKLHELMLSSHVFLLPSARIHIMSVLQSMAYGLVPIVSDGWGMREYVDDGRNGLVVTGRYGKVAWNDEQNGMLRESYSSMYDCDRQVAQNLVDALSQIADDSERRRQIGENARLTVERNFNLAQWNVGLKRALDQAWVGNN